MLPEPVDALIVNVHRAVGYPLAFVVAPLALASFAGQPGHRKAGIAYVVLMTFLYLTGTSLTLTRHEWGSWEFGRNLAFNLLGYSFLLHGFRAIRLMTRAPHTAHRTPLDRVLFALLVANVAVMAALAIPQNTPLRVFAAIGIGLIILDRRDWRAGMTRAVLYRRHLRYMLASYFYVLTVVSLVHLKDELSSDARWLWPALLGLIVIRIASGAQEGERPWRVPALRWAVMATVVLATLFGLYAGFELTRAEGINPRRSPMSRVAGP